MFENNPSHVSSQKLHNHFDFIGLYNTRGTTSNQVYWKRAPIIHIMDGKNGWQMNVTHGIVCKPKTHSDLMKKPIHLLTRY